MTYSVIVYRCTDGFANICAFVPETRQRQRLTFDGQAGRPSRVYEGVSLSPDGRLASFAFDGHAYMANQRLQRRLLLSEETGVVLTSVRPDRKRVALVSRFCDTGPTWPPCPDSKLTIVDSSRTVRARFGGVWQVDWAADRLILTLTRRHWLYTRVGPNYSTLKLLYQRPNTRFRDPAVSPDGRTVALTATSFDDDSERSRVALLSVGGRRFRVLTSGPNDSEPAWAPDGRRLVFNRNGTLWTVRVDRPERAQRLGIRGAQPTWGRRL